MQCLYPPSFFLMSTTGDANALPLSLINAVCSSSCTIFSISIFWVCGYLYGLEDKGVLFVKWICWSYFLWGGNWVGILNRSSNCSNISVKSCCYCSVSVVFGCEVSCWVSKIEIDNNIAYGKMQFIVVDDPWCCRHCCSPMSFTVFLACSNSIVRDLDRKSVV